MINMSVLVPFIISSMILYDLKTMLKGEVLLGLQCSYSTENPPSSTEDMPRVVEQSRPESRQSLRSCVQYSPVGSPGFQDTG